MYFKVISRIGLVVLIMLTSACSWLPWFGDDEEIRVPAELEKISNDVRAKRAWSANAGGGVEQKYVRLRPLSGFDRIVVANDDGDLVAYNYEGKREWKNSVDRILTGGVGGDDDYVVVGTPDGLLLGLSGQTGDEIWQTTLSSEVMAVSAASAGVAVVRTNDNRVHGVEIETGAVLWRVIRTSPALTLRGTGVPLVADNIAYVGFDDGRLLAISMSSGQTLWESRVTTPSGRTELDRMVDIDGQLAADSRNIYAVSYQGRLAVISRANGRVLWTRDLSSVAGVTVDFGAVYVTDADDQVWAFSKESGVALWKQDKLLYRDVTAPLDAGDYLLVGDYEGYVHILSKSDGSFVGRTRPASNRYSVPPVFVQNTAYFLDASGKLAAITLPDES